MKRFPTYIFPFCLWLHLFSGYGQAKDIDSLKNAWKADPSNASLLFSICEHYGNTFHEFDSLRAYAIKMESLETQDHEVKLLGELYKGMSYYMEDTSQFFMLLDQVIAKALDLGFVEIAGMACRRASTRCRTTDAYDKGIAYCKKGLEFLKKSNVRNWWPPYFIEFKLHNNLSSLFNDRGEFSLGLEHALVAEKMAERSGNKQYLLLSSFNLSGVFGELGSTHMPHMGIEGRREDFKQKGKNYMLRAYTLAHELNKTRSIGVAAYNLGVFYSNIPQFDSATFFLQKAILAGKEANYLELLSNAHNVLGGTLLDQKRYAEAEPLFLKALGYAEELSFTRLVLTVKYSLSGLYLDQGQYAQALAYAEEGLAIAKDINNKIKISRGHFFLYRIYQSKGGFEQALSHYTRYMELQKEIISDENLAQIEQLREQFDAEKRENKIEQLTQTAKIQQLQISRKNTLLYGAGILILFMGLSTYLWLKQRGLLHAQSLLKVENKFLRFQLNPHFFFHALISIQNYMMNNSPEKAGIYLAKIAKLMRQVLEHSREEYIALESEIDTLKNYMDLQCLRYNSSFDYEIEVGENIDPHNTLIPPMFIQPFVENSLEHGLRQLSHRGNIHLRFEKAGQLLKIEIKDNGIGLQKSIEMKQEEHEKRQSLATTITKERIQLINKNVGNKIHMHIGNALDAGGNITGTLVRIALPFQHL